MTFDATQLFEAMAVGLGVWIFTYGLNRVYLLVKSIIS